ncbi:MAG: NAD(P)H-dependent oxidoreductase subunit E [Bacillota bacterium]
MVNRPALSEVSLATGVPLSKIFGVVTFYAQFHLKPRGKHVIRVCLGTACHVRGGERMLEKVGERLGIGPSETTDDQKAHSEESGVPRSLRAGTGADDR